MAENVHDIQGGITRAIAPLEEGGEWCGHAEQTLGAARAAGEELTSLSGQIYLLGSAALRVVRETYPGTTIAANEAASKILGGAISELTSLTAGASNPAARDGLAHLHIAREAGEDISRNVQDTSQAIATQLQKDLEALLTTMARAAQQQLFVPLMATTDLPTAAATFSGQAPAMEFHPYKGVTDPMNAGVEKLKTYRDSL